jgi:hypothetical protein
MVMALDRDRKVMEMTPLVRRLHATPTAKPSACTYSGNISEVYTPVIGPRPTEKKVT